jgi:hypothetical protein
MVFRGRPSVEEAPPGAPEAPDKIATKKQLVSVKTIGERFIVIPPVIRIPIHFTIKSPMISNSNGIFTSDKYHLKTSTLKIRSVDTCCSRRAPPALFAPLLAMLSRLTARGPAKSKQRRSSIVFVCVK